MTAAEDSLEEGGGGGGGGGGRNHSGAAAAARTDSPSRGPAAYMESPSSTKEKKALLLAATYKQQQQRQDKDDDMEVNKENDKDGKTLVTAFLIMIIVGTGNRIFMKLQTYPMYNYPMFLNLFGTFVYIPACFMYIIPMIWFGSAITKEQIAIPKYKFMVMGLLDSVSGIMGVFAVNYISNAGMIVLLQQASIPISMAISKICLSARYTTSQYIGATIVVAGIFSTLIPTFLGQGDDSSADPAAAATQVFWMSVQVASCIPMCISSVYKEKALGDEDVDVIYLNGWVAVFQLLASLVCAIPSAWLTDLPLAELPSNVMDGWSCYLGKDSISASMLVTDGTHTDIHTDIYADRHMGGIGGGGGDMNLMVQDVDHCEMAPYYVSAYLFFNILYNIVLIVILKHGSASVLFMASTVMVPIGNVAFSLHFIPGHQDMRKTDVLGLLIIVLGLVFYRFSGPVLTYFRSRKHVETAEEKLNHQKARMVERGITRKTVKYVGLNQNQFDFLEPILNTRVWSAQKAILLSRSPAQIRGSFFLRLGIPPSPALQRNIESRNVKTMSSPAMNKAKMGYKRSPIVSYTGSPSLASSSTPSSSPLGKTAAAASSLIAPSGNSNNNNNNNINFKHGRSSSIDSRDQIQAQPSISPPMVTSSESSTPLLAAGTPPPRRRPPSTSSASSSTSSKLNPGRATSSSLSSSSTGHGGYGAV